MKYDKNDNKEIHFSKPKHQFPFTNSFVPSQIANFVRKDWHDPMNTKW